MSAFPHSVKFKLFLSLVVGFALGVVAMWFVVSQTTVKVFANQYLVGVMDQANVALHIRAGKELELLTNIEAALPSYVRAVNDGFKGNSGATNALWMVKAYYERNAIVIPADIKGILDSLPDKPRHRVRFGCVRWTEPHLQTRQKWTARNE